MRLYFNFYYHVGQKWILFREWMVLNHLKMNDSKTEEYIIFGNAFQRQKCVSNTVYVGNSTVSAKDSIIYLGAILDSQLNLKEHVKSKCQKAVYNFHCINNIKRHLSIESKKILVIIFNCVHKYFILFLYDMKSALSLKVHS